MAVSERHRYAANVGWTRRDPREHAEKVRNGRREMYRQQADPDGVLPEFEVERRIQKLIDAHCARMRMAKAARRESVAT